MRHRLKVAAGVLTLFAVSLTSMRQANGSDGWHEWTWRVIGVTIGVMAVNVLVEHVRLAWARVGRHGSRDN